MDTTEKRSHPSFQLYTPFKEVQKQSLNYTPP